MQEIQPLSSAFGHHLHLYSGCNRLLSVVSVRAINDMCSARAARMTATLFSPTSC